MTAKVYDYNKGPRTKAKDQAHYFWHYCYRCRIYTPFAQSEHEGHKVVFINCGGMFASR